MPDPQTPAVALLDLLPNALAGQVAVVTGAGQGIGREIALAFAHLGARLVIAEIDPSSGQETGRLVQDAGGQALFIQTDVSNQEEVLRLAERVRQAYGPVDILVNNAILCPVASVLDMDVELWNRVMAVNLRGTFLTCKAFLPGMLSRNRGVIVNMTSAEAMPNLSAYLASKQGIAAFSQSLAGEVGESGVRVIAFGPGFVDTPGLRRAAQGLAPRLGLSVDQFMQLSLHEAYPAAMPPDHAAAAAAYLVVRLADEYHGEQVTGYTVLEQAGFLRKTAVPTPVPASSAQTAPPASATPAIGESGALTEDDPAASRAAALHQAAALAGQLGDVLAQVGEEFNRLPVFVRPLARNGFKNKAGQSLPGWTRTIAGLADDLRRAAAGDPQTIAEITSSLPQLNQLLDRLATYFHEVPAETARFTKDEKILQEIARISAGRENIAHSLSQVLTAQLLNQDKPAS